MDGKAGLLKLLFLWMVVMLHSFEASYTPKKHSKTGLVCKPKHLATLTRNEVEMSLIQFDEANGNHLGTWPPGFPELTVTESTSVVGAKVQCGLLFLAQGLKKILEDQRNNLSPDNVSLHKALKVSIYRVDMLAACLRNILGGECSPKPEPPEMPRLVFERKQWCHTLLKTATHFLEWLQDRLVLVKSKVNWKVKIKQGVPRPRYHTFFEGSGYLL